MTEKQPFYTELLKAGGTAFPTQIETDHANYIDPGMTLRDWFAGQALVAIVSSSDQRIAMGNVHAKQAYEYADAMLTERSKTGERS